MTGIKAINQFQRNQQAAYRNLKRWKPEQGEQAQNLPEPIARFQGQGQTSGGPTTALRGGGFLRVLGSTHSPPAPRHPWVLLHSGPGAGSKVGSEGKGNRSPPNSALTDVQGFKS